MTTHFNATVSNFRDWFRRNGMKSRGWQVDLPLSPAIAQFSLSSLKLSHPMTLTAFVFYSYGMITPQPARKLTYFMLPKLYFFKMKWPCLLVFEVTFLLLLLHSLLGSSLAFYDINGFRRSWRLCTHVRDALTDLFRASELQQGVSDGFLRHFDLKYVST
jgi:hypothetical protein